MKGKPYFISILLLALILLSGCRQQNEKQQPTPEEIASTKSIGLAYLEENQLDKAEAEFQKLVKLNPDDASGYANLGLVYLRLARYDEAEQWLKKALKISPKDPDIRLILAKVYEMNSRPDEAITILEKTLQTTPGHVKTLYALTELYSSSTDRQSDTKRLQYTQQLVKKSPANIVPRLNLTDTYIRTKQPDKALKQLEEIRQIFPAFPKEAVEYYEKTVSALQAGKPEEAAVSFMIFHNYLKVTAPYQAGVLKLKGPEGFIGSPVITFDKNKTIATLTDWKAVLAAIHFTDITGSAGLDVLKSDAGPDTAPVPLTASDYDADGDMDIYAGSYNPADNSYRYFLFRNEWGKYTNVTGEAGIKHNGRDFSAKFVDYDNDGFLDLYIVKEGPNILFRNNGDGTFSDVTDKAGVGDETPGNEVIFFDYDHDGDLDFYILRNGPNLLYRNNADGTFTDNTAGSNLDGGNRDSRDAAFADFDDDGDIDLFVVNRNASDILFSNQRQGIFKDVTVASGLKTGKGSGSVSVGDYNNDGFPDLFVTSLTPGETRLYRNLGDGRFTTDKDSPDISKTLQQEETGDAVFLDFDNDGYLDLLVTLKPSKDNKKSVYLYHNDASGKLFMTEKILPDNLNGGNRIITLDYNEDGDPDVALADNNGSVRLLRNDGGNNFHYVKMKLVGLRTGSGKNNYYGIGAKVEIRAGNLYQSKVVTEPEVLFGLGPRKKADVIRILWTNGVPQNIFFPATDQDIVEEQQLKGSCPFLYTWNGSEYVFVKDIMWRSALGMPLGIMGEDKTARYAGAEPSSDYIRIPGELLKPKHGKYTLQVTDELWETIYFDKVELITVDHPDSVDIYVDEKFMPSNEPGYHLYQVGKKHLPVTATDNHGNNVLPLITSKDDKYVSDFRPSQYQGITEMHDLTLDLGKIKPNDNITLFLNGWIFPSDASINAAIAQSGKIRPVSPRIDAINKKGDWETVAGNISFPMGKDKTVIVDLSGKLLPKNAKIRIRTNMQVYWDYIFFTTREPNAPVHTGVLNPVAADLHYRGFSRTYRKGGRYGPHWFDYSHVSTGPKWRDLTGLYTRYGDVLPLLTEADDMYIIKNAGDETTIVFDAGKLPGLPEGWKRDFLIHSVGWVKDGDLNTATGQQVDPLPFHGMNQYPYNKDVSYPKDPAHLHYLKTYNTRRVTTDAFKRAIADADRQ